MGSKKSLSIMSLAIGAVGISAAVLQGGPPPGQGNQPPIPPGTTRYVFSLPQGFPLPQQANDNGLTNEGVALGKKLFEDVRLSGNNTQSCASCHRTAQANSDAPNRFSLGIDRLPGSRNAMPVFNLAYTNAFFWDGRASSLRAQSLKPIQDVKEMHADLNTVVAKISRDSVYQSMFDRAFNHRGINADLMSKALEQFMSTQTSSSSRFDDSQRGLVKLTPQEQRGFDLFRTPFNPRQNQFGGDCARCHGSALFTDFRFRNNGLDANSTDKGLQGTTGDPADFAKFKTPSLRNLTLTGPYMHDGRFSTLEQVVSHYSNGIRASATLDQGLARQQGGVKLNAADQAALVAFLRTLTDSKYRASVPVTP